jgi:hypothetical protein
MKTLSILGMAVATLSFPLSAFATAAHSQQYATEWSDKPYGATYYAKNGTKIHVTSGPGIDAKMKEVERMLRGEQIAQYAAPSQIQYQPPSFFQGSSGAPIVVPPTVINTQPNRCRQKRINILLFFDVESSDC